MWIFTTGGFVSIVAHRDQPGMMLIRARCREHLEAFLGFKEGISHTPEADYPYRATRSLNQVATLLADEVPGIDYDNFKAEAARSMNREAEAPGYVQALHEIWSVTRKHIRPSPEKT